MLRALTPYSPAPIAARTVRDLIATAGDTWGDAHALLAPGTDQVLTYRALADNTQCLAAILAGWGLGPAHRVATLLPAGPTAVGTMCAVMSQCTYAPLNPRSSHAEAMASLQGTKADCIIVPHGQMNAGRSAADALGIPVIEAVAAPDTIPGLIELTCTTGYDAEEREVSGLQLAYVLQTSGTTARPKFVPMSQTAFLSAMAHNAKLLQVTTADRGLHLIAPAHVMGITTVLYSFMGGAQIVCCPGLVAADFFQWVRRFQPTWLTATPALHHSIVAAAKGDAGFLAQCPPRFIRTGAAPMPPTLLAAIEALWHAPVIEAYGMSECPLITSNGWDLTARKAGSVGLANCGTVVALFDDAGRIMPVEDADPNRVGEIVIRGPHVLEGYEDADEENRDAFRDGWFHTGDLGSFDADGFLFYRGRKKELINRGGTKIAPQEIDEVVLQHPAVSEALTFALPDDRLGETVAVAVVLRPQKTVSELEIRQHVAGTLSAEKVPAKVVFVDVLPTGPTGKNLRIGLAATIRIAGLSATQPSAAFAATSDPVEDALLAIWQDVLDHPDPISVDAHFASDLGGDSLHAVAMLTEASRLFNRDLPVAALLASPTIRKLAAEFRSSDKQKRSHRLGIQTQGSKPPLFCFPGMHGNAFSFYPLARALGERQPTYAFTLPGVYGDEEPLATSIKDLATQFLRDIQDLQPNGSYHFAGYSFGGYLAIELALQLAEAGQRVDRLVMFDTRGPGYPKARSIPGRIAFHAGRLTRGSWAQRRDYLFQRAAKLREKALAAEQNAPTLVQSGRPNISSHSLELIREYAPRFYDGTITLIRAAEQPAWIDACVPDPTMGWGKWAKHVDVRSVPGSHVTLLERDRVDAVAAAMRRE